MKFTITIDLKDMEMPKQRKKRKKKHSDTPIADDYATNDAVWNSDVTPGFYKGK